MDYSHLSRESLIHEIEQLNKENEKIRLEYIGNQIGTQSHLNDIQAPVFIVNKDYSLLWANRKSADEYDKILNQKCYQVFFGLDDVCPGCILQECISTGMQGQVIVKKNTNLKTNNVVVHLIPLIRDGVYQGMMEIQYTDDTFSEKHFQALDKINELNKELEILSYKEQILHDLMMNFAKSMKVPLRSYMGFFNLIDECDSETLKNEYLDILRTNSENIYETLNRFLMFVERENIEIGGMKESFSIKKLIVETLDQVILPLHADGEKNYTLDYTETLPEVIIGDALLLKNTISYLLEFVQYISKSEQIEFRISDISQTHSKIILKLSMSVNYHYDKKHKVLSYFNVNHNTDFDNVEDYSQALGLALAERMIKKQNGTIEISTGLEGKLFVDMTLIYRKLAPRENLFTKHTEEISANKKKKVLIADFEKPNISLELFRYFDIYFAHTGDDAIQKYFNIEPDLTIINVMIERCDGFKVYDEVERRRKEIKPVVAISNKLVDNEREFLRDYGFSEYYPKPLDDDKLKKILSNYF